MNKKTLDMCQGPFLSKIIRYTIPIILTGISQLAFNAADLIIVGQFAENGTVSVAAVGATAVMTTLLVNLFIGLAAGAGVCVAHGLGARKDKEVSESVHTAIPTAIICGLTTTVIGLLFSEQLLILTGTPEDVLPLATQYLKIYSLGTVFLMVYNFGASILRAAGDTKRPLFFITLAGVVNILLNAFFVIVLKMDVAGVSLATTISQALSALLVIIALTKRTDACKLYFKKLKIHTKPFLKILRIGIPSGIQSSMFSFSNVFIQSSINSFGSVAMSGNTAAGSIEGFIFTSMNAVSQTSVNFVGQNVGAGKYDNVKKIVLTNLACVSVLGATLGLLAYGFAEPLLSLYIKDSPEAIDVGILRLAFIALPYCLAGIMDTMTGSLRGMGSSMTPMFITVLGVCGFRIAWIYSIFHIFHTLDCLYVSYPISWVFTFLAEWIAFTILVQRRKKSLLSKAPLIPTT